MTRSFGDFKMKSHQLKAHYDSMWTHSLAKFRKQEIEIDALIGSLEDDRYGMTLLARPSENVKVNIKRFLDDVAQVAPHQYFYPESDMHLTILSIISCYSGFYLAQIQIPSYIETIREIVDPIAPFKIHFKGITASPSCILIQGYPENNQLENLREQVRSAFSQSDLQHSIDKRYAIQTAHLTVIRFQKPLQEPEKLISVINQYREYDFGSCWVDGIELVGNNWYQQKEKVQLLKRFSLS